MASCPPGALPAVGWLGDLPSRVDRKGSSLGLGPDYVKADERVQKAQPSLLSVAHGGIYVMPHQAAGRDQIALFLDGQQVISVPPYAWPPLGMTVHTDIAHVQGHHVGIGLAKGGAAVVVARGAGASSEYAAHALGLLKPNAFGVEQSINITYVGRQPALHAVMSSPSGDGQAFIFPLEAEGPALGEPIAVPGQGATSDPPRACDKAARQSTPRLVVSSAAGTAYPVLVTGGTEPARALLTSDAVMHATVAAPCVAVLEAQGGLAWRRGSDRGASPAATRRFAALVALQARSARRGPFGRGARHALSVRSEGARSARADAGR